MRKTLFLTSKKEVQVARKRGRGRGRGNLGNARKKTFILMGGLSLGATLVTTGMENSVKWVSPEP